MSKLSKFMEKRVEDSKKDEMHSRTKHIEARKKGTHPEKHKYKKGVFGV